jgi:OmcA/MtrC family decaheme c-type cytochrome
MVRSISSRVVIICTLLFLFLVWISIPVWGSTGGDTKQGAQFNKHQLGYYLDESQVNFVRPGLKLTIKGASIGNDYKIRVTFLITDNNGLPLDRLGVTTPGVVSTNFIGAYIPHGQTQYLTYATRKQTGPDGTVYNNADRDRTGTYAQVGDGLYTYTFGSSVPPNYDVTTTHTVAMYASRNLTEFDLGTQYDNETFDWIPMGGPVTLIRDVVVTETCNQCHDPLALHGGSRREIKVCVTCHTPQTTDPTTGNTVDLKVMVHKIHAGPNLPSGNPYKLGNTSYADVTFPQELNHCEGCHTGKATQVNNWLLKPSRATCGSCHDDVNFASGDKHPGGPQVSDKLCSTCHIPEGEVDFDASIKGAHVIPTFSKDMPGVKFEILGVKNTKPGDKPTVTLKITDNDGFPIETSQMNSLSVVWAGPTTDYAGFVSENALTTPSQGGILNYTFQKGIPADAKGSYGISVQGYRNITLQPGTTSEKPNIRDAGFNPVVYVAVTDSAPVARRAVVSQENCNSCHAHLALHGGSRINVMYCVMCHNANWDDKARRPADKLPVESIHMKTMIHKIHTGEELTNDFTIYGFGNTPVNFNEVTFPGDRRNCDKCHVNESQQLPLAKGVLPSISPRDYINPMQPVTAACLSCHTSQEAASHALLNTSTLGESCKVCHGTTSEFSIDKVHAR